MTLNSRSLLSLVALLVLLIALVPLLQRLTNTFLPPDDFVEYWAAGRLNSHGENPYDPDKLLPLERSAGRDTDEAVMMWNPPWTLAFVMPFGSLDSRIAQLLWLFLNFIFIALGADLLWRVYDGPAQLRWCAWLLAFTFLPTFFVLGAGQIGAWVMAGAILFLFFLRQGWSMLAGAATVLLAIKPHLAYLFWIVLLVWGIRRDRKMLLGALLSFAAATALALTFNPNVLTQYWTAMTERPPSQWQSPTLGTLLRMVEGQAHFGLQFIPTLLGLGWLLWHYRTERDREFKMHEQMPLLLAVSFVTASYGAWPYDLVLLLPVVIHCSVFLVQNAERRRIVEAIAFWVAFNGAAICMNLAKCKSFWFIWMAPTLLIGYLVLLRGRDRK